MAAKASFWELGSWHLTEAIWALSQRTLSRLVCGARFSGGSAKSLPSFVSAQCINTAIKQLSPFWFGPWASAGGDVRRLWLCSVPGQAIPHLHPLRAHTGPQPGFAGPPDLFLFFPPPSVSPPASAGPGEGFRPSVLCVRQPAPTSLVWCLLCPFKLRSDWQFFLLFFLQGRPGLQTCRGLP